MRRFSVASGAKAWNTIRFLTQLPQQDFGKAFFFFHHCSPWCWRLDPRERSSVRCSASAPSLWLSAVCRLVGLGAEAVHLPIWHQAEWWACGDVTNDQAIMIRWQGRRAIDCHWGWVKERALMIRPQTPPISLYLFAVAVVRFLSNGGSRCVVSQCHLATHCKHLSPPYPYFMLLPFRPWATCCKASGCCFFGRHALPAGGGSSRSDGAAC